MTVVFAITLGLLVLAGVLTLARLLLGPSTLDRILAVDVLVMLIAAGVAVELGISSSGANLALLVAVVLLGFVGSVAAVRLAERRESHR